MGTKGRVVAVADDEHFYLAFPIQRRKSKSANWAIDLERGMGLPPSGRDGLDLSER
jgi:hypothetical protein